MLGAAKVSVYAHVTSRIIEALEQGVVPWQKPWNCGEHRSAITGRPYRGVNVLTLELTAFERGYRASRWLTYKQATRLGGHVRQGERGTICIWYNAVPRRGTEADSWDQELGDRLYLARSFVLFNVEQCGGLEALSVEEPSLFEPLDVCEAVLRESGAVLVHGANGAYFDPKTDTIGLPEREAFLHREGYYSAAFHELVHWTGAPHRLNRDQSGRFADPLYAVEELIAELGAAFVAMRCGIEHTGQAAAYIQSWLRVLHRDSHAIFGASRFATAAADLLVPRTEEVSIQADDAVAA